MSARAFRLCTQADVDAAHAHAGEAIEAWARDWTTGNSLGAMKIDAAVLATDMLPSLDDGTEWLRGEGVCGTFWARAEQASNLAAIIFASPGGEGTPPSINGLAATVGRQALSALLQRLAAAPGQPGVAPARMLSGPSHLLQSGWAAVSLRIEAAQGGLDLLVEPAAPQRRAPLRSQPPLSSAKAALAAQPLTVEARLGEIELELGALRTLAVGDVLRLSKRLDEGADLSVGGRRLPCVGYLAAVEGHVAVEIARQ